LNSLIVCRILKVKREDRTGKIRTKSGRALHRILFGGGSIGFDMKLNLAVAIGLLNAKTQKKGSDS
jgi:hypothetical protein